MEEKIEGLYVSHLMIEINSSQRQVVIDELDTVINKYIEQGIQIVTGATYGHESDALIMVLAPTSDKLLEVEQSIKTTGVIITDSFLSITELSEYATTEDEEQARVDGLEISEDEKEKMMQNWRHRMDVYEKHKLYPELPDRKYLCFYPMSKSRGDKNNWYALDFETRAKYMRNHGQLGRQYSGKILQLITGATGLTDWEWGVTLLSDSLNDIKDIVYEMRFDEASALYGEFGHFTIAKIAEPKNMFS